MSTEPPPARPRDDDGGGSSSPWISRPIESIAAVMPPAKSPRLKAVGHRMADCYIDIECLRLTTYQAVSLLDSERPALTEVQIAKIWAGDTGHRVSYATQHVHGGTGIDREYPLWRYCLWLRQNEMTLGCSAAQTAALGRRLAAGEALFT